MAIAGGNITLDSREGYDRVTQTEKVTSPYHSNGTLELLGGTAVTSSNLTATNKNYFFGIANSATTETEEWNVTFGSSRGFGALVETNTKSETEAIYGQFASLLLAPSEVTGGFFISSTGNSAALSTKDTEIFVLTARRSNMKDRLNKGTWTVALSGSSVSSGLPNKLSGSLLELTDDSVNNNPTATPAGDRYNIVSGAAGVVHKNITDSGGKCFGHFYPDMGVLVFSGAELSASLPGTGSTVNSTVTYMQKNPGFGFATTTNANRNTALRFVNCLTGSSAKLSFRDEEDQVSAQYFCRVRSGHMNFSNNPTFISGSLNEMRQKTMKGNPTTFITSVQLYNESGDVVAVGNLSTPLKKNFSSEATIKVKLNY